MVCIQTSYVMTVYLVFYRNLYTCRNLDELYDSTLFAQYAQRSALRDLRKMIALEDY